MNRKPLEPARWPSEIDLFPSHLRADLYVRSVALGHFDDTLSARLSAGIGLSAADARELAHLFGQRCSKHTKQSFLVAFSSFPERWVQRGFWEQVERTDRGWQFYAASCYPSEFRAARELVIQDNRS